MLEELKSFVGANEEILYEEEVDKVLDEIFDEVKPESQKDMGQVMKLAQEKLKVNKVIQKT